MTAAEVSDWLGGDDLQVVDIRNPGETRAGGTNLGSILATDVVDGSLRQRTLCHDIMMS